MSAQHAPHSDAPEPVDPYGIVPDTFCDDWDADSIPEALAKAEAAPSTTDPRAQQRCPNCLAARLTPLPDDRGAAWACTECNQRHDAVLPSQAEADRQATHAPETERESALPRCRACLSTALYPIPESAPADDRWACLDCGAGFDAALPSLLATRRGEATSAEKQRIGEVMRDEGPDPEPVSISTSTSKQSDSYGPSEQGTLQDLVPGRSEEMPEPSDDPEALGVEPPTTPTVSEAECARWRRDARGAQSLTDAIEDKRGRQTLKFHVRGQCVCDVDEPALSYVHNGSVGEWVMRDD